MTAALSTSLLSKPALPLFCLVLLGACQGSSPPQGQGSESRPAHMEGLDLDGRIPKASLPEDLPHPARWRYKPEGRISDGDFFERFLMSSFIAPFFFFEGDVGTGFGVGLTDLDFRNQRRQEFANASVSYTTEGEQSYRGIWKRWLDQRDLEGGGVIQEERHFVQVDGGYVKALTRRFFGLGPNSRQSDETSFSEEVLALTSKLEAPLDGPAGNWVGALGLRLEHRNLAEGFVSSVPDMGATHPSLFVAGDDIDSLWLTFGLRYDTRDSQSNPYRGSLISLWAKSAPLITDGQSGMRYGLRTGLTVPLPGWLHRGGDSMEENPPTDVLAFNFDVEDSAGELPFWALPSLGGSQRMRGYISGRFVDRAAWYFGAEYRFVTIPRGAQVTNRVRMERFGMALFYEIGSVAAGLSELAEVRSWSSYGVGARINLERAATFRADFGWGEDSTQFTLTFGQSF
jgi:hypothetical protein